MNKSEFLSTKKNEKTESLNNSDQQVDWFHESEVMRHVIEFGNPHHEMSRILKEEGPTVLTEKVLSLIDGEFGEKALAHLEAELEELKNKRDEEKDDDAYYARITFLMQQINSFENFRPMLLSAAIEQIESEVTETDETKRLIDKLKMKRLELCRNYFRKDINDGRYLDITEGSQTIDQASKNIRDDDWRRRSLTHLSNEEKANLVEEFYDTINRRRYEIILQVLETARNHPNRNSIYSTKSGYHLTIDIIQKGTDVASLHLGSTIDLGLYGEIDSSLDQKDIDKMITHLKKTGKLETGIFYSYDERSWRKLQNKTSHAESA